MARAAAKGKGNDEVRQGQKSRGDGQWWMGVDAKPNGLTCVRLIRLMLGDLADDDPG